VIRVGIVLVKALAVLRIFWRIGIYLDWQEYGSMAERTLVNVGSSLDRRHRLTAFLSINQKEAPFFFHSGPPSSHCLRAQPA
jgi:hypothetical protein